jgi:hypothetical protein
MVERLSRVGRNWQTKSGFTLIVFGCPMMGNLHILALLALSANRWSVLSKFGHFA